MGLVTLALEPKERVDWFAVEGLPVRRRVGGIFFGGLIALELFEGGCSSLWYSVVMDSDSRREGG